MQHLVYSIKHDRKSYAMYTSVDGKEAKVMAGGKPFVVAWSKDGTIANTSLGDFKASEMFFEQKHEIKFDSGVAKVEFFYRWPPHVKVVVGVNGQYPPGYKSTKGVPLPALTWRTDKNDHYHAGGLIEGGGESCGASMTGEMMFNEWFVMLDSKVLGHQHNP